METLMVWLIALLVVFFVILVNGLCLQYVISYWASYFKKESCYIPLLPAAIGGIFLPVFPVQIAIATWVLSYVVENQYFK